ncbi:hypothetical protein L6164_022115 [Bauhinia variegata]|uniref:Uncharacterized protein n=1 Tax=Bauhinia variegata TaxID=167791 RepID=A0ACB9MEL8_BAUVA|nr:hypothetical protein L6164_022115 [Bauhinia variegata]
MNRNKYESIRNQFNSSKYALAPSPKKYEERNANFVFRYLVSPQDHHSPTDKGELRTQAVFIASSDGKRPTPLNPKISIPHLGLRQSCLQPLNEERRVARPHQSFRERKEIDDWKGVDRAGLLLR